MKHRIKGKKLNKNSKHRKALFKNLLSSLVKHQEVTTTETKAKIIKRLADKVVNKAKQADLHRRRQVQAFFNDKKITNLLVDSIAPQMDKRSSGYTTISRIGRRRGDNTMMAKVSFVDNVVISEKAEKPKKSKKQTTKK